MESRCGRCGAPLLSADGSCSACGSPFERTHGTLVLAPSSPGAPGLGVPGVTTVTPAPQGSPVPAAGAQAPPSPRPSTTIFEDPLLASIPVVSGHKTIGGVRLLRRLGAGGMGAVYLGVHETLDRQIAVKILPAHLMADPSYQDRFLREAQVSFTIEHPNVVRTINAGREHGILYLQMELVDGYSAGEHQRRKGRLSEVEAVAVILDAARGLAEAHRRGIVHRDVKPDNILIRAADGRAKIADLGLARVVQQATAAPVLTSANVTLGTPSYMAPEQIEDPTHVAAPADVYSLGAALLELLTGRPPFEAPTIPSLFHEIISRPPPDLLARRPEAAPALATVVARALAKRPADRYPDAGAFAAALEGVLPGLGRDTPPRLEAKPLAQALTATVARAAPTPGAMPTGGGAGATSSADAPKTTVAPSRPRRRILFAAGLVGAVVAIVVAALGVVAWNGWGALHKPPKLVLGLLPDRRLTTDRIRALEPLQKFVANATGREVELFFGESYEDNVERFVQGRVDLAQFGGVTYVLAKQRETRAVPLFQREVDRRFQALFLTRAESPLTKLADLKGKRFAFVDPLSTSGFVVPAVELLDAGIDPKNDLEFEFTHSHDATIEAILLGSVAAGVVDQRVYALLCFNGKLDPSRLRQIAYSRPFPDDVWVAGPSLPPELARKVRDAFTTLDPRRDAALLGSLEASRYVPVEDGAYDQLRDDVRRLQARGLLTMRAF